MWLRVINVISQITIIILAVVIVITMSKKQMLDSTFSSFEAKINTRLEEDRLHYDEKVKMVQDNLNRYQLSREQRAQHFNKRLDELYSLYKKDPSIINEANPDLPATIAKPELPVSDKNIQYIETRINRVDEKVDNLDNRITSKISVMEKKVELIEQQSKTTKIVNNNQSSAVINMPIPVQQ